MRTLFSVSTTPTERQIGLHAETAVNISLVNELAVHIA